jgi:hypothetical protein
MPKQTDFPLLLLLPWGLFFLPGCLTPFPQHAYYISPLNGNNVRYQPLPLLQDSSHTAIYTGVSFFTGSANEQGTDYFTGGRLSLSAAHHYGMFQFYYGIDGTLGSYSLGRWDSGYTNTLFPLRTAPPFYSELLNSYSGPRTFGSAGFQAGIDAAVPVPGGEWRFLGLESSLHREFGDYLSFRKELPDSLASLNIRNPFFGTFGITSEMIGRTRHGEFGFRAAYGWMLGKSYRDPGVYDDVGAHYLHYRYFTFSLHYTYERYTGFMLLNAATKASSFQLGLQYRLSRPRLPVKEERQRHYSR